MKTLRRINGIFQCQSRWKNSRKTTQSERKTKTKRRRIGFLKDSLKASVTSINSILRYKDQINEDNTIKQLANLSSSKDTQEFFKPNFTNFKFYFLTIGRTLGFPAFILHYVNQNLLVLIFSWNRHWPYFSFRPISREVGIFSALMSLISRNKRKN